MADLREIIPGQRRDPQQINQVVSEAKRLGNTQGGLNTRRMVGANNTVMYSLPSKGKGKEPLGGDTKVLSTDKDATDSWSEATDKVPVQFKEIHCIFWDSTQHKIMAKYRTLSYNGVEWSVSAPGEAVALIDFDTC